MESSLFSTKDIVKYLIVAGLIYSILKMIPSQQIANKDLILIMVIITVGFVSVDCMFFKKSKSEGFANEEEKDPFALDLDLNIEALLKKKAEMQANKPVEAATTSSKPRVNMDDSEEVQRVRPRSRNRVEMNDYEQELSRGKYRPDLIDRLMREESKSEAKIGCAFEVEKVKRQLEDEIDDLKVQLQTKAKQPGTNSKIASRYFESLMSDLVEKGLIDVNDIENIKLKMSSKLLTMEEVISSLETIKKEGKPRVNRVDGKIKDDNIYNELPSDFYSPLGDKIANEWENDYSILNTNKWQVPMPRPPVCINTMPCKVCPTDSSNYPVNLKQWDDARYVTSNKVNKKWAQDQSDS
jgi:hypothetical protein